MGKKKDVKTYEIDASGKVVEIDDNQEQTANNDVKDNELEEKETYIRKYNERATLDHDRIIHANPFMVRASDARDVGVNSIEDFCIKTKRKEERQLKEILRTEEFRLNKRKKLIINAIKHWIKEYKENKSKVLLKVSDIKEAIRPADIKKISVGAYIFLPLCLAVLLIIYFALTKIWAFNKDINLFGGAKHIDLLAAHDAAFAATWVQIVGVVGIYLAITSLLFIGLYHAIFHEFVGYSKTHTSLNAKLTNQVNAAFSHKSKKTMKYYQKALRRKECKVEPLMIEDTAVTGVDFSDLEALSGAYAHKMAKLSGRKTLLYVMKFILFKGTYLCTSGIFSYVIYEVVSQLF